MTFVWADEYEADFFILSSCETASISKSVKIQHKWCDSPSKSRESSTHTCAAHRTQYITVSMLGLAKIQKLNRVKKLCFSSLLKLPLSFFLCTRVPSWKNSFSVWSFSLNFSCFPLHSTRPQSQQALASLDQFNRDFLHLRLLQMARENAPSGI